MPGLFSFRRGQRDTARAHRAASGSGDGTSADDADTDLGREDGPPGASAGLRASSGTTAARATSGAGRPSSGPEARPGAGTGTGVDIEDESSDPANAEIEGMWVVIRPAAIVPEHAARRILVELARRDLGNGGEWQCEPQLWSRFDAPTADKPDDEPPVLMGTIHVTYGTPTKYEITLYRVSITAEGVAGGWSVPTLTDEALGFGGLTLAQCPRAMVQQPPRPFRY